MRWKSFRHEETCRDNHNSIPYIQFIFSWESEVIEDEPEEVLTRA